jgi:hypothetical protein
MMAITEVDGISVKRGDEALKALHSTTVDIAVKGYATTRDIETLRGVHYNLGAMLAMFRSWLQEQNGTTIEG